MKLLNFNGSAGLGKSSLDLLSLVLGNAFLNGLGCALNQILSVLQAQTGDLANSLDNVQLVSTKACQNNVELGLLFSSGSSCTGSGNNAYGSSSGYAELLFNCLYKVSELKNCKRLYLFKNVSNLFRCHF